MEGWSFQLVLETLITFARGIWLLNLCVLTVYNLTVGVQFIFIPQNTTCIDQPALFQGLVDTDGISITWAVNGSTKPGFFKSLGIVVHDGGTQQSNLTIPGDPILNRTTVTCLAAGLGGYYNTSSAILYIQGQ